MSFIHALKWSFLAELASKAITPIVFIVLARLLTPEDFGVMSAAMMVIAFSQIFWEAGMGKALIQRQTDVEDAANVAFWINLGLGILIASLLFWGARPIALTFFQDERVTAVLQVMTLQVFLGALSSVQTALLQKQMGFKELFWVRMTTVALPGMASIPLAWSGMGYWALVVGTLVCQAAQVAMLWRMSCWRPSMRFVFNVAKPMAIFGAWVGASGLLAWFYVWADSLIIGKYLGVHELGLYRTGNQFSGLVFTMVFGPVVPVLYSHLSQMNGDLDRLKVAIQWVVKVIVLVSLPLSIMVFEFSDLLGDALFGEKWHGIGLVIGLLALMHGFSWIVGMNGEIYRAMGRPSLETIVTAVTLAIYLAVYIYAVQIGFEYFVWARLFLALGALLLHLLVLKWVLMMRVNEIILHATVIATVCFGVISLIRFLILNQDGGVWMHLAFGFSLSFIILGSAFCFFERNGVIKDVMSLAKAGRA